MKQHHVEWARQHDWFVRVVGVKPTTVGRPSLDELTIECRCDMVEGNRVFFTDYNELRIWAGY